MIDPQGTYVHTYVQVGGVGEACGGRGGRGGRDMWWEGWERHVVGGVGGVRIGILILALQLRT